MTLFDDISKKPSMQSILAIVLVVFVCLYIIAVSFIPVPKDNSSNVNYSLAFITGVVGIVIGFYFGSSKKDDTKLTDNNHGTGN